MIRGGKVIGAVYIDRRDREQAFNERDLKFLLAFGRQIVQGMEISLEISTLENKLIADANMKFEDLRREFECPEIIGCSQKLFDVLRLAAQVSATDASVILLGENGTGKDMLARAIHRNSRRAEGPFIAINCSAIPNDLLESELFGYESGAFTGATKSEPGKIESADGGTLFLDEIADLDINLQAKLLRILQTQEIERLGSLHSRKIDIRVIAATNRNIAGLISTGKFREDLYYRLKVIEITMPPLNHRKEDIAPLVTFFLEKHKQGDQPLRLNDTALNILEMYNWPCNIRELENVFLRSIVLAGNGTIGIEYLPEEIVEFESEAPEFRAS